MTSLALFLPKNTHSLETERKKARRTDEEVSVRRSFECSVKYAMRSARETSKRAEESDVEDDGSASGSAVGRAPEERRAAAMSRNLEAESAREERQEA